MQTTDRGSQHGTRNLLLLLTLLAAILLRVTLLADVPAGVDYDEAGNFILAGEIAAGQSRPVFIRAYAGREAVFYWLAAASMRLLGSNLFAFRLAAALCGLGTVLLTFALAREMLAGAPALERRWVPLLSAALIAVSYWHVHVSRYGFRVNAMTLFVAATTTLLWRGLGRGPEGWTLRNWVDLAAAGLLCGISANTYLAIRAFPLVLLPFALWVILTWGPPTSPLVPAKHWRWLRVQQIAFFGLVTLAAFAPLGIFFLRNPAYFGIRMGQASVFAPEIHGGDLWGTVGQVTIKALGIFTVHGDADPIYNTPGKPIFGPWLGAAFVLGLLTCLYRAVHAPTHRLRTPYLLILIWLPVMLIPNILGARGVPHALRSMGLIPVVYTVPALGLTTAMRALAQAAARVKGTAALAVSRWTGAAIVVLTLTIGGAQTWHDYLLWAQSTGAYYNGSASLRRAAEALGKWNADEVSLWVSNSTYRHTTYAAMCPNYARLRWFNERTLVFPLGSSRPALYLFDFTNPLDPVLARHLPPDTLQHRDLGPDGNTGFEAYLVQPEQMPVPDPQFPARENLGNTIAFLGYDVNAPPVSGGTLDVTLYWRALRDGDRDDYAFFAHVVDDLGFRWGSETFFNYPSAQWRQDDVMLFRRQIAIAPGTPPGAYTLVLGVTSSSLDARLPVLNETGQMAGTSIEVGPLDIARAADPPVELPAIQQPIQARFGDALHLLGTDRDRGDLRPGETLALTLYWQAAANIEGDRRVSIWLEGTPGRVPLWEGAPVHGLYPFDRWQAPEFVRDRYALRLPTDAPAGDYELRLALLGPDSTPLPLAGGSDHLTIYTIHVKATDRLWEPPSFTYPVGARLGEKVDLLGYSLDPHEIHPGETLHLTLIWRCLNEMDVPYTVFTHLLDAGEQVRGQKDNPPVGGRDPTTLWIPGEIVVDEYEIRVQLNALPGTHVIEVGMYDPTNVQRLLVLDPSGVAGDRILLGSITIRLPSPSD